MKAMRRHHLLGTLLLTLALVAGLLPAHTSPAAAQDAAGGGVTVSEDSNHDTSPPLRDLASAPVSTQPRHVVNSTLPIVTGHQDRPDTAVQSGLAPAAIPTPILNF